MVTNTTTANRYTVSGNSYTISFPYWKEEEIKAVVTLSDGSLQDLVLNTDYSVSTPDGNNGTLTKITAWTGAEKLTIYRDSAKTQDVDLVQGQKINADTIENAFDHAIAINQELQEKLSRSITTSIDEAGSDISIPNKASRAGMLLGFDNSGENAALRSLAQFDIDVANTASNASSASTSASNAHTSDLKAEGYAVGTQGGVPVSSGSPYYNNNAKYFKDYVQTTVGDHATALAYLATSSANVDTVAGIGTQVNTVAGISSNVTTVAGNTSNINTVAGNNSNITTVAGVSSAVSTVAGISSAVSTVAGNNANVSTVASNIAGVNTVASNIAGVLAADDYASLSRQYSEGKKLDGTTVAPTDEGYHNNSKYYLDIVKQTISGALRYQGVWTTTGATDYSGISLPRLKGDMFYCQGSACTIGGVTYSQGDYIIFNQDVSSGTITTSLIDKIDNTETVTPDNLITLTNKTIDADNNTLNNVVTSKNISNCITQIPQDIVINISGSNAVVKSGSKIYYPDGFTGTTPKFSSYTLPTDKTIYSPSNDGVWVVSYNIPGNGMTARLVNRTASGTTTPTSDWWLYFNTSENIVYDVNNGTPSQATFPIAIVTVSGGAITSIDQVFNGMGYIGSTAFVLPGLKMLLPNGRNADGTLKSIAHTVTSVQTVTNSSSGTRILVHGGGLGDNSISSFSYDENSNYLVQVADGTLKSWAIIGICNRTSGVISDFKPKIVFHAVDYNDWQRHIGSGEVHDVTSSMTSNFETLGGSGQGIFWCVMNRVCYVTINAIRNIASTSATTTVVAGLPKAKMQVYSSWFNGATGNALVFVSANGTELRMGSNPNAASNCLVSFSYPVADDWVES